MAVSENGPSVPQEAYGIVPGPLAHRRGRSGGAQGPNALEPPSGYIVTVLLLFASDVNERAAAASAVNVEVVRDAFRTAARREQSLIFMNTF